MTHADTNIQNHGEPSDRGNGPGDSGVCGPIVERLNELLGDRTFAEIARVTEFNSETVRRYMRGGQPSVAFVVAVARQYRVSLDWLLLGEDGADGLRHSRPSRPPGLPGAAEARRGEDDESDRADAPRGTGSYGVMVRGVSPGGALREGA